MYIYIYIYICQIINFTVAPAGLCHAKTPRAKGKIQTTKQNKTKQKHQLYRFTQFSISVYNSSRHSTSVNLQLQTNNERSY